MAKKFNDSDDSFDSKSVTISGDSVTRWCQAEEAILREKLSEAMKKPDELEKKLEAWVNMTESKKRKKCLAKMRSTFLKPYRLVQKLRLIGDDIYQGTEEGLLAYRIRKIIDLYLKQKAKLDEALDAAHTMSSEYPDIAELIGGFIWEEDVPPIKSENGEFLIATTSDVKSISAELDNDIG